MSVPVPKISVVTPSLNQGRYIEQTIRSVLDQDYPALEYIVVDGGSTDNTRAVLERYGPRFAHWTSEPDKGQASAINRGWAMSTGAIIAWINADDVYLPGALAAAARAFSDCPHAVAVVGAGASYDSTLTRVLLSKPPAFDPARMIETCGSVPLQPAVFMRRRVLDDIGPLREDLHYVLDWEYWIRAGLRYPPDRFVAITAMLAANREWPQTKTNTGAAAICREHRRVLDELFSAHRGDIGIQALRHAAYRSSYRKEADLARLSGDTAGALRAVFRAWAIRPLRHNPARELALLAYILLGPRLSRRLKAAADPLRARLNRTTGF